MLLLLGFSESFRGLRVLGLLGRGVRGIRGLGWFRAYDKFGLLCLFRQVSQSHAQKLGSGLRVFLMG